MDFITWICRCGCGKTSKSLKLPEPSAQYYAYSHRPSTPIELCIKGRSKVRCGTKDRTEDHTTADPELEQLQRKIKRLKDE